ncbi:hypothetical protein CLV44_11334 [Marinobacterium halophilum]|uniref:Uncharacterized protein n=1 Tax=Marinobacterium halophilum TaxID=267374 RepID=A0A2P8EUU8_9GAMM|nr:hypothetical protein [Marinobacterium halophilum]PSL13205.1 hypothetical protein CLV44_11334 [Marinobacterium halophilum]
MRNLSISATPWQACLPDQPVELPAGEQLLALECCEYEHWQYQRLALARAGEAFYYLYAASGAQVWVLGVFDTAGQADMFLALHNDNPLNVPALEQRGLQPPAVSVEEGVLRYPRYAGMYRVGFKSYRVEPDMADADLLMLQYVERYNSQLLGVLPEKEACLAIYSHFDGRLRGCKMC